VSDIANKGEKNGFWSSGFRFAVTSGFSVVATISVTALCHEVFGLSAEVAYFLALALAMMQNFLMMRYFVHPDSSMEFWLQFHAFVVASLAFRGIEYAAFLVAHSLFGIHYLLVMPTIMLASFASKFLFYRATIFQ
jgi:putative flippase GtrA